MLWVGPWERQQKKKIHSSLLGFLELEGGLRGGGLSRAFLDATLLQDQHPLWALGVQRMLSGSRAGMLVGHGRRAGLGLEPFQAQGAA